MAVVECSLFKVSTRSSLRDPINNQWSNSLKNKPVAVAQRRQSTKSSIATDVNELHRHLDNARSERVRESTESRRLKCCLFTGAAGNEKKKKQTEIDGGAGQIVTTENNHRRRFTRQLQSTTGQVNSSASSSLTSICRRNHQTTIGGVSRRVVTNKTTDKSSPIDVMTSTLSRQSASAAPPLTPKQLGSGVQMISKEEHERERQRWTYKMEEIEQRLQEAEASNSDMNLLKAELNKRIVELDRNQRPLVDQNRRLTDRNRLLQAEVKKIEQKLAHAQDDYLTLKDSFERMLKENGAFKEKRAFPEKMEELDRYRSRVLEYSKCITALRQAALEKDRRYELLVHKFRRLRKCLSSASAVVKTSSTDGNDDDRVSAFGGGGSDSSVTSLLDTIAEDLDEEEDESLLIHSDIEKNYVQLARDHEELQRVVGDVMLHHEQVLRDQLADAHSTINQLRALVDEKQNSIVSMTAIVDAQRDQLVGWQTKFDRIDHQLMDATEHNELLEFQILEMQEIGKQYQLEQSMTDRDMREIAVDTNDLLYLLESTTADDNDDASTIIELSADQRSRLNRVGDLLLPLKDHQLIRHVHRYIENLESQLLALEMQRNEWIDERHRLQCNPESMRTIIEKLQTVEAQLLETNENRDQLAADLHRMRTELDKCHYLLQTRDKTIESERSKYDALNRRLVELTNSRECEIGLLEQNVQRHAASLAAVRDQLAVYERQKQHQTKENSDGITTNASTDLERRYEEAKYRLKEALCIVHEYESMLRDRTRDADTVTAQLASSQAYCTQLEHQFTSQIGLIQALKTRLVDQNALVGLLTNIERSLVACDSPISIIQQHFDRLLQQSSMTVDMRTMVVQLQTILMKMSTRNNDNVDQPRPQLVDIPPKNSVCYYVLSDAYVLQVYDDWSPSTRSCSSSGGDAPDDDDDDSGIASIFNNTGKYRRKSPMNGSVVMKCASSVDDGECAKSTVDQSAYEMCHMRTSLHRIE